MYIPNVFQHISERTHADKVTWDRLMVR